MAKLAPILLAEDDPNDAFLFACAVKHAGVPNPCVVMRDGQQTIDFLELLSSCPDRWQHPLPAVLLLDLKMPRLSGFDVLAWLQTRADLQSMPVVVLSSSPQAPDMLKSRELGAVDYQVKPSRLEDLVALIQQLRARWLQPKAAITDSSSLRVAPPQLPSARPAAVVVRQARNRAIEPQPA